MGVSRDSDGTFKKMRMCLGMNESPYSPQGFCQHSYGIPGRHNGKKIEFEDLPDDCQKIVKEELEWK